MKKIWGTLLISIFTLSTSFSCSCFYYDLCEYISYVDTLETKLIFMGSFIQRDSIDQFTTALEFKVDKVYDGEIVTVDSPFYVENNWTNTDSTVWILNGDSAACYRWMGEDQAIFILDYQPQWAGFGYTPTICANDYLPVVDNMVSDIILNEETLTVPLQVFEEALMTDCTTLTSTEDKDLFSSQTIVYPQPASDFIKIDLPGDIQAWDVDLFNATGQQILAVQSSMLDVHALNPGIYFIRFEKGNVRFTKRVVKF